MAFPWSGIRDALASVTSRIEATETALERLTSRMPDLGTVQDVRALVAALDGERAINERHRTNTEATLDGIGKALEEFERQRQNMNLAISEGIERVERSERRVHAVIQRAQRRLAESGVVDDGLEAEARDFLPDDEPAGPGGRVQQVQAQVGFTDGEASSVKGVPLATMKRFRGIA